ncbi:MAG TPA: ABC-2 family transporter protein [Haliangiales bacterium]|nr:ABC-2 family transporter protein [Haliangiales bacterium]
MRLRHVVGAFPALFRVGLMEAFAYRAEFFVWMLTTTMPLVMMALWTAVAAEAPFQGFGPGDFVAYYLAALIVRTLTSCWLVWEINQQVRMGYLSMMLLRPIHPIFFYAAEHLAAVPMRAAVAVPVALILLITSSHGHVVTDPVLIAVLPVAIAGAWFITFFSMMIIGSLAMMIDRSTTIWEVWFGVFALLSGYLVPIKLLPSWMGELARWLPFRYMLGYPVELLTGMTTRGAAFAELGIQWAMVVVLAFFGVRTWNAGVKRFEAFGN